MQIVVVKFGCFDLFRSLCCLFRSGGGCTKLIAAAEGADSSVASKCVRVANRSTRLIMVRLGGTPFDGAVYAKHFR